MGSVTDFRPGTKVSSRFCRVGGRRLHVVAQSEVKSETGVYLEIVLHKQAGQPEVIDRVLGRILIHSDGKTQQEIGESIALIRLGAGLRAREAEGPVVVQQRGLNVLRQRHISAEADGMAAMRVTADIAQSVKTVARYGPRDGLTQRKIAGHGNVRKSGRPLRREIGAEVVK